ncbi:MAG TPA: PEGA domain-containing protein, partial [Myxococcales bacterium]|nr:PEGA domain-containing protein [Myxococcales bacterium]
EERDGEVSIPNAPRHSGTHLARRRTMETQARGARSPAWFAAGAVVLLAVAATAYVIRPGPPPAPAPAPPVAAATPAPPPAPAPAPAPAEASPAVSVVSRVHGPETRRRTAPRTGEGTKPPAPPQETEIFTGEGRLRIGSLPMGGEVTIAGRRVGETPIDMKVRSGPYTVEIASPELKKRGTCAVKVLPDRTARVKFDFQSERCSVETN